LEKEKRNCRIRVFPERKERRICFGGVIYGVPRGVEAIDTEIIVS